MGGLEFLILPLLLVGLLWMMGAPQRRLRKEQAAMLAQLGPGAEVMTHGGLYGTVVEVDDDVVVLETSPGVTMRWATRAIAKTVVPEVADDEEYADDEYDEADEEYVDDEAEVDEEYVDDEAEVDEEYVDDEAVADEEYVDDDEATDDEWADVEVPDDASSLTPPEDDEKPGR